MPPRIVTFALLAVAPLPSTALAQTGPEARERVAALIEQLGSVKYVERREAQRELEEIGLAAFDQLYAATEHQDPEIAATSARLLSSMAVRWARPGDSAAVRARLDLYGRLDEGDRSEAVAELAALPDQQGTSALCRIARFDLSASVATRAAAAAMAHEAYQPPDDTRAAIAASLDELDGVYGPSSREGAAWLRWFTDTQMDPAEAAARWSGEVQRLRAAAQRNGAAVDSAVIEALAWNLLRAQLRAGRQEPAVENVTRLLEAEPRGAPAVLKRALEWMLAADANQAIDRVLEADSDFLTSKRGLYLAADARLEQGRADQAERLAERALEAAPDRGDAVVQNGEVLIDARVRVGLALRDMGRAEWALGEFRRALEQAAPASIDAAFASWQTSDVLQDRQDYRAASETLRGFIEALDQSNASRRTYQRFVERIPTLPLPTLNALRAREAYYRALAHRKSGETAEEHAALLEALEHDATDADVVIALYRATDADQEMQARGLEAVRSLADRIERELDQDPGDPMPYNQWAWLVSNTEGDYQKALRYSKRSLELRPGDAGYLDTLGRCYYAVGNLQKAVEVQRRAVREAPIYEVMRRQLEFFERELAKQREGEPSGDSEDSSAEDA